MNIYEHQSTKNPNIPLRDLFYVAKLYEKMINKETLYSSKLISIPMPKFVVFYNGIDADIPEVSEYRLSDLYQKPRSNTDNEDVFDLELKVKVLNINADMNYNMKKSCKKLMDYCSYVEKVRELSKTLSISEAVEKAVDYCIANDILKDFLVSQKAEVIYMSIFEFNEEEEMIKIRNAEREVGFQSGREEGLKEGLEEGREEGRKEGREERTNEILDKMLKLGMSYEDISDIVDMTVEEIHIYADKKRILL